MQARTDSNLSELIYVISGRRVMLDEDLARLYGVKTSSLTQAVRRNSERVPNDFAFLVSNQEVRGLISQTVTSSLEPAETIREMRFDRRHGGRRKASIAFAEQGIAMLSSVLRSPRAVQVNIEIMRTFVELRNILTEHKELSKRLNDLEARYDGKFAVVFQAIRELMEPTPKKSKRIGF